jgi:heme oxygenase (mycobilin-producing)
MLIKINALTVPADSGDELAHRFAARAGAVDGQPGFVGFELLRPLDGRDQWLVVTRWADEESYEAWRTSPAFGHGHGGPSDTDSGARPVAGADTGHGTHPPSAPGESAHAQRPPVSVASELWSYEVVVTNAAAQS